MNFAGDRVVALSWESCPWNSQDSGILREAGEHSQKLHGGSPVLNKSAKKLIFFCGESPVPKAA